MFLAGCTKQSGKELDSSVVALVNGVEITQNQVNFIFKRAAKKRMDSTEQAELKRSILGDLVRTELLSQEAKRQNIQNTREYTVALYQAEKKVLADLITVKSGDTVKDPTDEEIKEIVDNNPRLFSGRKLYVYDEIYISSIEKNLMEYIDNLINTGSGNEKILHELKRQKITYTNTLRSVTSDQLPQELEQALGKVVKGRSQVIKVSNKYALVITLHDIYSVPVSTENAMVIADNMQRQYEREQAVSKKISQLINSAEIKYLGEYSINNSQKIKSSISLPYRNKNKAELIKIKKILFSVFLSVSVVSAVMSLTSTMRIITGALWLPHILPVKTTVKDEVDSYEITPELHFLQKAFLFLNGSVIIGLIISQIYILSSNIDNVNILLGILSGIVIGYFLSRIYRLEKIQNGSDMLHNILNVIFILPIVISLLFILRFSVI
jgi:EpsD family peptidyl-prolyl cis-trans isomerase